MVRGHPFEVPLQYRAIANAVVDLREGETAGRFLEGQTELPARRLQGKRKARWLGLFVVFADPPPLERAAAREPCRPHAVGEPDVSALGAKAGSNTRSSVSRTPRHVPSFHRIAELPPGSRVKPNCW